MSDDFVIRVEKLGKKYSLRHQRSEGYTALRDVIADKARNLFRRNRRGDFDDSTREEFWALKDVSFNVRQGEAVGIIGRNGAGKSTLLKILSRITEPTEGRVRIKGRVASLLEVGTGFHPELTGRENVFLNGAILGMSRSEIKRKFDEIVAFAEIERFLDTPVKRYSSGMYVRLAFAVAAHLEPEILIVDEVLAVGDAEFQKKCLGKMQSVAKEEGRTILFVSHNLSSVGRLCNRGLVLHKGRVIADEGVGEAIRHYTRMDGRQEGARVSLADYAKRSGDGSAKIVEACLRDEKQTVTNCFQVGDTVVVEYRVEYQKLSPNFSHSIELTNSDGVPIYHLWDVDSRTTPLESASARLIRVRIPDLNLCPDDYYVTVWVGDAQGHRADRVEDCLSFTVEDAGTHTRRQLHKSKGLIYKQAYWSYFENGHT